MNERDADTFARFARRFTQVEAEVKDPPPLEQVRRDTTVRLGPIHRSMASAAGAVALVVIAVSLVPFIAGGITAPPVPSSPATSGSSSTPPPSASSADPVMVSGPDWSATCGEVEPVVCEGVAALAQNNLGRARPSGVLTVQARPVCPPVSHRYDPTLCWQVYSPVSNGTVCMVIAKRSDEGGYGQVAGDVPGRQSQPSDVPGCPSGTALVPLDPSPPPERFTGPCGGHYEIYDRFATTIEQDVRWASTVLVGTVTGVGKAQWNTPDGDPPKRSNPRPPLRLLRVEVETLIKGTTAGVTTLWITGGVIGCHSFGSSEIPVEVEVGSRFVFFLADARSARRGLESVPGVAQMWPVEGDQVRTRVEGVVPLLTFIERAISGRSDAPGLLSFGPRP